MARKEKIVINRDKTLEPIDLELDAAMGALDDANRHIDELLTSMDAHGLPLSEGTAKEGETPVVYAELNENGEPIDASVEASQPTEESATQEDEN